MNTYTTKRTGALKGEVNIPGDKSVSHRSIMLGSIANGTTIVRGFLRGEDNYRTLEAFRAMGIEITDDGSEIRIAGKGLHGLTEPGDLLDCGNSGTSMRLLTGLLAGQKFFSVLTGDQYLRRRPMKRVADPLSYMGASISGREGGSKAPLAITGRQLHGIRYESPVASAQVKSAILLAGLYAEGETSVTEPHVSRDHSERMLAHFGADITVLPNGASVRGGKELTAREIDVPGDISSAAFFLVAGLIVPGSELLIRGVGINPTRTGILDILRSMGGDITLVDQRELSGEPVADLLVRASSLRGIEISGDVIPRAIDELPVVCIAAACAEGTTVIKDAQELRVKETDRIAAMAKNLRAAGVDARETADGMEIAGGGTIAGCTVDSFGDHRIAMSMLVAGLVASDEITVTDTACIATSFPGFTTILERISRT